MIPAREIQTAVARSNITSWICLYKSNWTIMIGSRMSSVCIDAYTYTLQDLGLVWGCFSPPAFAYFSTQKHLLVVIFSTFKGDFRSRPRVAFRRCFSFFHNYYQYNLIYIYYTYHKCPFCPFLLKARFNQTPHSSKKILQLTYLTLGIYLLLAST